MAPALLSFQDVCSPAYPIDPKAHSVSGRQRLISTSEMPRLSVITSDAMLQEFPMASFDPIDQFSFDPIEPPPRPTTPPVRRGFLRVLGVLLILALLVYGVPNLAERIGYSWETGRARAA